MLDEVPCVVPSSVLVKYIIQHTDTRNCQKSDASHFTWSEPTMGDEVKSQKEVKSHKTIKHTMQPTGKVCAR